MLSISETARTLLTIEHEQSQIEQELAQLNMEEHKLKQRREDALRRSQVLLALARAVVKEVQHAYI